MLNELNDAARTGDVATVKKLICMGADVNARDDHDFPPVFQCIIGLSNLETIQTLISNGADVNITLADGCTPLHLLAMGPWDDIAESYASELIAAGAITEAYLKADCMGQCGRWTPLLLAAYEGPASAVDFLLKNGANVEACDEHGRTALMLAAQQTMDTVEKIHVLRAAGADFRRRCDSNKTAYDYARVYGEVLRSGMVDQRVSISLRKISQYASWLVWRKRDHNTCSSDFAEDVYRRMENVIVSWPEILKLLAR